MDKNYLSVRRYIEQSIQETTYRTRCKSSIVFRRLFHVMYCLGCNVAAVMLSPKRSASSHFYTLHDLKLDINVTVDISTSSVTVFTICGDNL